MTKKLFYIAFVSESKTTNIVYDCVSTDIYFDLITFMRKWYVYKNTTDIPAELYKNHEISRLLQITIDNIPQSGWKIKKYKLTKEKATIIYKNKSYKISIYIYKKARYCKNENKYILLSNLMPKNM